MYLVTGATGLIGRPLVETLLAEGAEIRAVTRDPHNAGLPAGVQAVAPEAIHAAFKGVRGLSSTPAPARTASRSSYDSPPVRVWRRWS